MVLFTLVMEIYPDGPNKVSCCSTLSSRSGRTRPTLIEREVGSSSPMPLCHGSTRTPMVLSSCSGALMLRRRAVPLIGSGTTCCRPRTPHRCPCTGASSDAGISLKPTSCCRSPAKSPSTGRTCDLVTWILGVTLTLGVGVSEQFSKRCEIEVLVVYEVKIRRKSPL